MLDAEACTLVILLIFNAPLQVHLFISNIDGIYTEHLNYFSSPLWFDCILSSWNNRMFINNSCHSLHVFLFLLVVAGTASCWFASLSNWWGYAVMFPALPWAAPCLFAAHGQMPVGKYEDTGGTQASEYSPIPHLCQPLLSICLVAQSILGPLTGASAYWLEGLVWAILKVTPAWLLRAVARKKMSDTKPCHIMPCNTFLHGH